MKALLPASRRELLAILEAALREAGESRSLDQNQAALDCAGVIARVRPTVRFEIAKAGRGRKPTQIRILAAIAADTYFYHTGKGPGSARNENRKMGGHYPKFVGALARAAGIAHNATALPDLCNQVRKSLNRTAGLGASRGRGDFDERKRVRAAALKTHVAGYDDAGFPVFGGYEAARRPLSAKRAFAGYLKANH